MTEQQRSEAVTEKKRCCCQCGKEMWCYISEEVQAAIAERDATIAALRAEVLTARKDAKTFHEAWKSAEKENQRIKASLPTTEK